MRFIFVIVTLDLLAYNNEYDVRMCFYTILQVERDGKIKAMEGMLADSGAWKCVSPHVIDIYYNPTTIFIYTAVNCLCSKVAFMRDIWCRAANKPHTHTRACAHSSKIAGLSKAAFTAQNETILEMENTHARCIHSAHKNWNKMQWIISLTY